MNGAFIWTFADPWLPHTADPWLPHTADPRHDLYRPGQDPRAWPGADGLP